MFVVARRPSRQYRQAASKWIFPTWTAIACGSIGACVKMAPIDLRFAQALWFAQCCGRARSTGLSTGEGSLYRADARPLMAAGVSNRLGSMEELIEASNERRAAA
jgi:hypothetical protein